MLPSIVPSYVSCIVVQAVGNILCYSATDVIELLTFLKMRD